MDEGSIRDALLDYLSERADAPFGDVEALSGRTLQPFSLALRQAAENLLFKARRALDDHDVDRAATWVDRAVQLPFDEHEEVAPAAQAVHMDLFCAVTDAAERAAADDSRWLDAALDVLGDADTRAACDLRDVLVAIDQDYVLSAREHARIHAAIASVPERAELQDLDLSAAELREHVMSILDATRAYAATLHALDG